MGKDLFDLDDSLLEKNNFDEELDKADILCMREQYDRALEIYNKILDQDFKNEKATLGLLKVHSEYFNKYEGDDIEKDLRVIARLFPNCKDQDYLDYLDRKNKKQKPKAKKDNNSSFDEKEFDLMHDFYLSYKDLTSPKKAKVFDYFLNVYSNDDAPMKYRANAAHYIGYISDVYNSNRSAAFKYYTFAVEHADELEKGDITGSSFNNLGIFYHEGYVVKKDVAKAKEIWLKGAKNFDNELCKKKLKYWFDIDIK